MYHDASLVTPWAPNPDYMWIVTMMCVCVAPIVAVEAQLPLYSTVLRITPFEEDPWLYTCRTRLYLCVVCQLSSNNVHLKTRIYLELRLVCGMLCVVVELALRLKA